MGTMIHSKGVPLGQSFDEVNLSRPEIVEEIHRAYVAAGARMVETNTFGANRAKLEAHGLSDRARAINSAAVTIARRCAGDGALVAGSVGPTGRLMRPLGPLTFDEALDAYTEQITALCDAGVDAIIIETMQDLREAKAALLAARCVASVPVISLMSFGQEGRSMMGTPPEVAAVVLGRTGADLVGSNCGTGPQDMLAVVQAMARVTSTPLVAQPNAGLPRFHEGRLMYLSTPEYMADFARRFVEAGAAVVGGCCGTTPEHIRAIASAVDGLPSPRRAVDDQVRLAGRTRLLEPNAGRPILVDSRSHDESQPDKSAEVVSLDLDTASGSAERLVELAQASSQAGLFLVGSNPSDLEAGVRAVEGRALVSLRGPSDRLTAGVLPLARRYGAVVLVRVEGTLDQKLTLAREVIREGEELGLRRSDVIISPGDLFGPDGAADDSAVRTMQLLKQDLGLHTAIECGLAGPAGDAGVGVLRSVLPYADVVIADPSAREVRAATGLAPCT
jgi:5-methyltetrahydrofolate--homocysteine methyltransferase